MHLGLSSFTNTTKTKSFNEYNVGYNTSCTSSDFLVSTQSSSPSEVMSAPTLLAPISLLEGLSSSYDISALILGDSSVQRPKTSSSIIREFENDKWGSFSELLLSNPDLLLSDLEAIEDGVKTQFLYLDGRSYSAPPNFLREYILMCFNSTLSTLLSMNRVDSIIEIGAGYGSKIINLYSKHFSNIPRQMNYYALDISSNGLGLAKHFASKVGFTLSTIQQDLRINTELSLATNAPCLVMSSFGLHYLEEFTPQIILGWISSGVTCGIHFEPLTDQYNTINDDIYIAFARKYYAQQDYTFNIGSAFQSLANQGLISLSISPVPCGYGLLPGWLLNWSLCT